jgi:hypothetical protein
MPIKGSRRPPGPKGQPIVGMALNIRRDPLNALRTFAREYGDVVRFHVLMQERILLNHPDFIEQVLVLQQSKFHNAVFARTAAIANPYSGELAHTEKPARES